MVWIAGSIGKGGFREVYLAYDKEKKIFVAEKILKYLVYI
jgi:serine/threonine protein kinase